MKKKIIWIGLIVSLPFFILSCSSKGHDLPVITSFDIKSYSGTWYEVARIDNKFEKNLNNVTATYTILNDGNIQVVNRGYNPDKKEWKDADGKAKFRDAKDIAKIKVSFFGPFYSDYNVIGLDDSYQYALVAGGDFDYLWILSRTTTIPDYIKDAYLKKATELGYDTNRLIWIEHNKN